MSKETEFWVLLHDGTDLVVSAGGLEELEERLEERSLDIYDLLAVVNV